MLLSVLYLFSGKRSVKKRFSPHGVVLSLYLPLDFSGVTCQFHIMECQSPTLRLCLFLQKEVCLILWTFI